MDALADLFRRADIDLLAKTFTVAQEERVVERLHIPVKKGHKQVEKDFLIDIQSYIRNHATPSASLPSLSTAAPSQHNQAPDHVPHVPPHVGGGRKDKVRCPSPRNRCTCYGLSGFNS
jgi:hypothetical protein